MKKLYPSLLSADFSQLNQELHKLEQAGVDGLHFDVMDGQFVPNISVGFPVLEAVRRETTLPIDVHLMIAQPERYIEQFAQAGADFISVHVEATPHIHRALELIKLQNIKAGVVINPGTPVELIKPVLSIVDYVLVMTVNPGFGGQHFIQSCVAKVQQLAELKAINSYDFDIEVDGGINDQTIKLCAEAGASMFVAGSYFFKHHDYAVVTQDLKG
ncbi:MULTISPECIES: ribulose-phosphate 3-epimerase [Staphylococcus]|uniref:Ribulose-phosphate 3-epimerase n=2 Tax=Staphylococcus lugdunensis TaxID=28035 RepID=A0ABX6BVT4_STALU|nr:MULTISPECIES: ribulose-phosphate 3-epimerase [Staphylococcus]ADC87775.1 Ribulose-phosphate 3-epimerase [Staphylococcus lugdunensis HKU09-01]ARJ09527.1 ribulose-phosphate 3-epimerase [Staphylococcus lugdunensis]ARJ16561.1 ribulose-phosphate 3-epimerase [Staphylococcus lugdunensis]ARJ29960.1 ribulose-phosphate 3-epimerase [Staphylococcus lugdunensis]EKS24798.1 ribulose-phosphate 3-epimerase [Staphylococcus lugdunensis ACS-027-V-Sch2]